MHDQYIEVLVKRKPIEGIKTIKQVCLSLVIAMFLIGCMSSMVLFYVLSVVFALFYYFIILRLDVEFEYYYLNGELDISQIFNRSKRKEVVSLNESTIVLVAPVEAQEVQGLGYLRTIDCSSNDSADSIYAVIYNHQNTVKKVLINKNDDLLKYLKRKMPNKVKL